MIVIEPRKIYENTEQQLLSTYFSQMSKTFREQKGEISGKFYYCYERLSHYKSLLLQENVSSSYKQLKNEVKE